MRTAAPSTNRHDGGQPRDIPVVKALQNVTDHVAGWHWFSSAHRHALSIRDDARLARGRADWPAGLRRSGYRTRFFRHKSAEVIPLLQRRGLFRTAYEGKTLREHYGLAWPKSAFKEAALQQA